MEAPNVYDDMVIMLCVCSSGKRGRTFSITQQIIKVLE